MTGSFSSQMRGMILQQCKRANLGHIGPALSVVDIIAALYEHVLRVSHPADPDRDRFVLSKGHAALALYAALCLKGFLSRELFESYCQDGSVLGVHPDHATPGVDFASGSLGHGLSLGAGAALAARMQRSGRRVYVLVSDAECNEGSLWEAVMFAAHHRLNNLVVIIDLNGQQALGRTSEILSLEPMAERWRAFGWDVAECDGHDPRALLAAFDTAGRGEKPLVIVARTVSGKGVSFMEGQIKWHYWPMSDEEYSQAREETGFAP